MRVVESVSGLDAVSVGDLVHLQGEARSVEVERAVIARGGWVDAWAYPTRQLKLFGGAAPAD